MIISHNYNIQTRQHELCLLLKEDNYSYIYLSPDLKETEKYNGIVNWLNKCFNEKETSRQSL